MVEEGVVKTSEICRIVHIPRKPNSTIALLFTQNIFFAQTYSQPFRSLLNDATSSLGFLGQWFNNLQRAALLTASVEYDKFANLVNNSWLW